MTSGVVHQPRIAFDGAVALVRAAQGESTVALWYADQLAALTSEQYAAEFWMTRTRLGEAPEAWTAETGKWRVRLEDALQTRPKLAAALTGLTTEVRTRL